MYWLPGIIWALAGIVSFYNGGDGFPYFAAALINLELDNMTEELKKVKQDLWTLKQSDKV
jgi:hypothetical protein